MERGPAVSTLLRIAALLCCLLLADAAAAAEPRTMVLVVRSDSPIADLDSIEVRKLYLGIPVWRNGHALQPLLNRSSPQIQQIFLQTIVAMSEANYERRVLQMAIKFGRSTPRTYDDVQALEAAVRADEFAVTYMWSDQVQESARLKWLRVLWRE
jgi:hypothetical protein